MLPLPATISMFGLDYPVALVPDLVSDHSFYGETIFRTQTIRIDESLPLDGQWCTLVHEALHIINERLHLGWMEEDVACVDTGVWELVRQLLLPATTYVCEVDSWKWKSGLAESTVGTVLS